MTGRTEEAIRVETEALSLVPAGRSPLREALESSLARYRKALPRQ